jgi:hypothetical protein
MEKYSRIFSFVLRSCLLLETFHLYGGIEAGSAFSLDFRHHDHLKTVKLEMRHSGYYIFQYIFGR